jgi:predicted porin
MQKKLIAAAVASLIAVPALAQTNVTISGHLRAGYDNYSVKDCAAAVDCRSESKFSDQNSRIIFNIVEDLGGGLKAWGQLDSRFTVDQGGQSANGAINWWAQGNTGMGLMHSSWGKVTLGHWDVYYNEIERNLGLPRAQPLQYNLGLGIMSQVFNPVVTGNATGAAASALTVGTGTRTSNLLMWDSPNWNGFTGSLAYSTAPNAISNEGTGVSAATNSGNPGGGYAWTMAIRYNNGPWAAGYAHWDSESEDQRKTSAGTYQANKNDLRGDRIWGGYTFAMGLKIGFAYDWSRNEAGQGALAGALTPGGAWTPAVAGGTSSTTYKRTAWYIPVSYSFGPHALYASYARAGDASNTPGVDTGASAWNLGYDYAFSKRTSMGIYYTALNNKSGGVYNLFSNAGNGSTPVSMGMGGAAFSSTGAGADARQWYIGMAHSF